MNNQLSKVVAEMRGSCPHGGCRPPVQCDACHWGDRIESAAPVEVELPPIDRDEAFQRDYIPLGRTGWELQTKGKGSTYRVCDKDGDRLAIPDVPYLHETLTRMARDVHDDYATLARQLAEVEAGLRAILDARCYRTDGGLVDLVNRCRSMSQEDEAVIAAGAANVAEYKSQLAEAEEDRATARRAAIANEQEAERLGIQLAEATRRLGEMEEALRQISSDNHAGLRVQQVAQAALTKSNSINQPE